MSLQAFGPRGSTYLIAATDAASAPLKIESGPTGCYTYQFVNKGSNLCYFAWSQQNRPVAAIPAAGTPAQGVCILPNEIVIYNLCPNVFISAICETGLTTNLLITPGEGM